MDPQLPRLTRRCLIAVAAPVTTGASWAVDNGSRQRARSIRSDGEA